MGVRLPEQALSFAIHSTTPPLQRPLHNWMFHRPSAALPHVVQPHKLPKGTRKETFEAINVFAVLRVCRFPVVHMA
jgi:hypothetical protein